MSTRPRAWSIGSRRRNRTAALRARDAAAFGVALRCLADAAALLLEDAWESDYRFKLDLELRRAECELITGEPDVDTRLSDLSVRAQGPLDAAAVTCRHGTLSLVLAPVDR